MADITKCNDSECKLRKWCYRFTAPSSEVQSFFAVSPRVGDACLLFWDARKR